MLKQGDAIKVVLYDFYIFLQLDYIPFYTKICKTILHLKFSCFSVPKFSRTQS